MTTVRSMRLVALCAVAAACSAEPSSQVITGRVDTTRGPLAIRAIADGEIVTAAQVRNDGSFTLVLPEGSRYRLEVLTRTGVKNVVTRTGGNLRDVVFTVCEPIDPFDVGEVGAPEMCGPNDPNCMQPPPPPPCDPMVDPDCKCLPDGTCCSANDPNCQPPPPCMDPSDPNCGCQADGTCCQPGDPNCPPQPCTDPMDPNCPPPSCDPMSDPECKCFPDGTCCPANDPSCVPPCTDPTDPNCGGCTDPMDPMCCAAFGTCPPPDCQPGDSNCCDPANDPYCGCDANGTCPCMDPSDPNCMGGCLPDGTCPPPPCMDPNDPGCAPPCENPMDPETCKDPCLEDPMVCGCTNNEPDCWPPPSECDADANGMCDPGDGMTPDNVPGDFGCNEMMP